jgi:hypothetical protein
MGSLNYLETYGSQIAVQAGQRMPFGKAREIQNCTLYRIPGIKRITTAIQIRMKFPAILQQYYRAALVWQTRGGSASNRTRGFALDINTS